MGDHTDPDPLWSGHAALNWEKSWTPRQALLQGQNSTATRTSVGQRGSEGVSENRGPVPTVSGAFLLLVARAPAQVLGKKTQQLRGVD